MITVGELESKLSQLVPDDTPFIDVLNQVIEQFIMSGKWSGTVKVVTFKSLQGYITLPRRWSSILGAQLNGNPIGVFSQFHEFVETGLGELDPEVPLSQLTEAGRWPFQSPQNGAKVLRIRSHTSADDGKRIRLFGVDQNGHALFTEKAGKSSEGLEIILSYPYVDTAIPVSVTSATKDITIGPVNVYEVDNGTEEQVSHWEPTEQFPSYARYKIGTYDGSDIELNCLCKREFVKLNHSTDIVVPSNLRAIKLGIMAVVYEDNANFDEAGKCWGSAYSLLNSEIQHQRGNAQRAPVAFRPWGKKRMNFSRLR